MHFNACLHNHRILNHGRVQPLRAACRGAEAAGERVSSSRLFPSCSHPTRAPKTMRMVAMKKHLISFLKLSYSHLPMVFSTAIALLHFFSCSDGVSV
jgi:hypothetical protein